MTISDLRCDVCGRLLAGPADGHGAGPAGPQGHHGTAAAITSASAGQIGSAARGAVRFVYDPGIPELRDDSGLTCGPCWDGLATGFSRVGTPGRCASCGEPVTRRSSMRLRRFDDPQPWWLCAQHTVAFLNTLRTVEPKLDPAAFRFPAGRSL